MAANEFDEQVEDVAHVFRTELTKLESWQMYNLPNLEGHVNHGAAWTRPELKIRPGVFLDKEALGVTEFDTPKVEGCDFTLRPANRLGREDSHNKVFFGRLTVQAYENDESRDSQVAVKRCFRLGAGLGEIAMFQYLRSLGLPTFKPVAFSLHNSELNHVITEFKRPVATMDTVEWRSLTTSEKWRQVQYASDTLAVLHSNALFHGDAEFKNIAFDDTGDLVIIDPELMVSARDLVEVLDDAPIKLDADQQIVFNHLWHKMRNDFTAVCKSVDTFVFGTMPEHERPKDDVERLKQHKRYIFEPYRVTLIDQGSENLPILLRAYDTMLAHKKRLASQGTL